MDLVFPQLNGLPQDPANASRDWGNIKRALGLPAKLHFHDLRHTYASTLEEMDVSVKKIQLLMGHASATFTMDTYIHKTETMMDGVKEKIKMRMEAIKSAKVQIGNSKVHYTDVTSNRWDTRKLALVHPELEKEFKKPSVSKRLALYRVK